MHLTNNITLIGPGPKNDSVIKEKKTVRYEYPAYQLAEFSDFFLDRLKDSSLTTIDLTSVCNGISNNGNGSEMFHSFNVLLSKSYTVDNIIDYLIDAKDLLKHMDFGYESEFGAVRIVSEQVRRELELRKNFNRHMSDLKLIYGIICLVELNEFDINEFDDSIIKLMVKIISNQSEYFKINLLENLLVTMPKDFIKLLWLYMFSRKKSNHKYKTRRITLDPSRTVTPFKSYEIFK